MTTDQMGFVAILLLVGAVIAGVLNTIWIAWVLVIVAVLIIVMAKMRK